MGQPFFYLLGKAVQVGIAAYVEFGKDLHQVRDIGYQRTVKARFRLAVMPMPTYPGRAPIRNLHRPIVERARTSVVLRPMRSRKWRTAQNRWAGYECDCKSR